MPTRTMGQAVKSTLAIVACLTACGRPAAARQDVPQRSVPLVLAADEGERRVRRMPTSVALGSTPFVIKVDRKNGGAPNLVMGYEQIAVGRAIQPHVHPGADEIIFVHRGAGAADVGDRTAVIGPGATIYIPRLTRVTLRNTGGEPLVIAFFFDHPGFEEYLRDASAPEGQPAAPLSPAELSAIRERHRAHVVYERP